MSYHDFSNRALDSACSEIRDLINNKSRDSDFDYFFEIDDKALKQMLRPQKESLLHSFSVNALRFSYDYWLKKVSEHSDLLEIIEDFESHKIVIPQYIQPSYEDFDIDECDPDPEALNDLRDAQYKYFYKYIDTLRDNYVTELVEAISKEAMESLFQDRRLMKAFNQKVAEYLNELDRDEYSSLFTRRGYVRRFSSRWPSWLQDALTYRENGRCAICGKDLTRLIGNDAKLNIDHIVPLALGGTNDSTNLQLICSECNLDKLDHTVITSNRRKTYFN